MDAAADGISQLANSISVTINFTKVLTDFVACFKNATKSVGVSFENWRFSWRDNGPLEFNLRSINLFSLSISSSFCFNKAVSDSFDRR
ncbi:hypothetical protein HanRHA438_Chr10g0463211 [Helianthus annuus]|nr:hypothetical protein HanRHA438_Chr10g0463211 [Helianthus annuus]